MRGLEIVLGIVGTSVILFYLFRSGSETSQIINSLAGGSSKFVGALQGRTV
jgi:hypothetical protein